MLLKLYKQQLSGVLNLFHATGNFLYPLKTLENQTFSVAFRGYRKGSVVRNGLITTNKQNKTKYNFLSIMFVEQQVLSQSLLRGTNAVTLVIVIKSFKFIMKRGSFH